ncbi:MAG: hypothetical protein OXT69_11520 [Candidatus Poribacteria bacterium]|nr:hypothetical protein [Candidatus Poribacteria bacterium]
MERIFHQYAFGEREQRMMDHDGHYLLPGVMTKTAQEKMTEALRSVQELSAQTGPEEKRHPQRYSAEWNEYLASLIAHPQMLELARRILGKNIRYDHCVALNRPGGNGGIGWHSHAYSDDDPSLGFVRIFFYVNGFEPGDGGLKVSAGSHLFRDARIHGRDDDDLRNGWLAGKTHLKTGEPLSIQELSAPAGTVALMWTHAAHAVSPRRQGSPTRWTAVYAYRNPGRPSGARWIGEAFEKNPPPGAEGLMSLM